MKSLRYSLNEAISHQGVIVATDDTIHQIVKDEIKRLGHKVESDKNKEKLIRAWGEDRCKESAVI